MVTAGRAEGNHVDGGYGLPVGSRFVATPRVAFGTSASTGALTVGLRPDLLQNGLMRFDLGVDAQPRESSSQGGTNRGLLGRATLGW